MENLVLSLHLLFILYMVGGFPIGLWLNHRLFRFIHAGLLALITLLMVFGIPCPLTILEEVYSGRSYEGSFIAAWLKKIIYLEWFDPNSVFIGDIIFAILVFSSFFWRPTLKKIGPIKKEK